MAIFKKSFQETRRSKQSTKKVSFNNEPARISEVEQYENIDEIWYSDEDEVVFRQRDAEMANLLTTEDPNAVDFQFTEDSPRGLEYAQPENSRITFERRKSSRAAVVATQRLFQKQNRDGSDSIARAYQVCCVRAKNNAIELAVRDAQFVTDHVRKEVQRKSLEKRRSFRPTLLKRERSRRSIH